MNDLSIVKKEIDNPGFVEKFAYVIGQVYSKDQSASMGVYEQERLNFLKKVGESTSIPENVTMASVQGVFMEVVTNGLSFSNTADLVYLKTRNIKNRAGQWETRLFYQPSPKGNIYLTEQAGSITNCSEPISVLYSDQFECGTKKDGTKYLEHKKIYPKTDKRIMCVYCWVTLPNGTKEPFWLDEDDMERLKGFSAKERKGEANALYRSGLNGQPDEGFWKSKVINFALKNKRKKALQRTEFVDTTEDAETVPTEDVPHEEVAAVETQPSATATQPATTGPASYDPSNVYPDEGNYRQPKYREEPAQVQTEATVNDEPF